MAVIDRRMHGEWWLWRGRYDFNLNSAPPQQPSWVYVYDTSLLCSDSFQLDKHSLYHILAFVDNLLLFSSDQISIIWLEVNNKNIIKPPISIRSHISSFNSGLHIEPVFVCYLLPGNSDPAASTITTILVWVFGGFCPSPPFQIDSN